ncbi:MAG TPA: hypothetical protein VNA04_05010, partial [Thermoanaerobaculia bacterium]|nr:hypothetical protein [Thermoanaerobaculia bacterium]
WVMPVPAEGPAGWKGGGAPAVLLIALAVFVVHMLTNHRYGFHRDELQVLDDAGTLALELGAMTRYTIAFFVAGLAAGAVAWERRLGPRAPGAWP